MTNHDKKETAWPGVSVVVVTRGHHALAERAVRSLLATDYPAAQRQIVVVEETDAPQPIPGLGVKYHTIPVKSRGVSFARNTGLDLCDHEIVAFTDDDCEVDKSWLREIVRPLIENPGVAATAGAVLVPPCGPVGQCENILGFPGGGAKHIHRAGGRIIPMRTFSTCNCAIHRELAGDVHFQEGFQNAGEDELLSRSISARFQLLYTPFAIVRHQPRDSLGGVFRWFVRRGQARVHMARHVASRGAYIRKTMGTSMLLRLFVFLVLLAILGIPVLPAVACMALLYYVSVLWRFRWARRFPPSMKTFLILPLVRFTMDVAMDIGVLRTLLKRH